jgi:hypothetical protein
MPELDVDVPAADRRARNASVPSVLVCVPDPDGSSIADALRARGLAVSEVAVEALAARATAEAPQLVLIDVDAEGGADVLARVRHSTGAEILSIGNRAREGARGFFERPVDLEALAASALAAVAAAAPAPENPSLLPPSLGSPSLGSSSLSPPSRAQGHESDAPPSDFPSTSDPLDVAVILPADENEASPSALVPPDLSPELTRILQAAEERVGVLAEPHASNDPAPNEAQDLLLPAELLAALDEPLDPDDDGSGASTGGTGTVKPKTAGETGTVTGAIVDAEGVRDLLDRGTSADVALPLPAPLPAAMPAPAPPPRTGVASSTSLDVASKTGNITSTEVASFSPQRSALGARADPRTEPRPDPRPDSVSLPSMEERPFAEHRPPPLPAPPSVVQVPAPSALLPSMQAALQAPVQASPTSAQPALPRDAGRVDERLPAVLGEGDAVRALASLIGARVSGSLALGPDTAVRRVVLHDGDIVTAASSSADETLLAFLVLRGEVERDVAARLASRLPAHGRHAGAALIAHGQLVQDDLWPTLRAHAEWIIGRAVACDQGTCELEDEPPGRLKAEPNVFGGATGAEVLLEQIRRVIPPDVALRRLGGPGATVGEGPRRQILVECALRPDEEHLVRAAAGRTVGDLLADAEPELADVLLGLASLGVLDVQAPAVAAAGASASFDPLDEEALRQRVRARMALVEDGDYFALLGIARSATGYEVRRAYLELRRSFEPGRVLTARTADLATDVRLVVAMLDEAYDILREPHRRDRYRRAIEAGPP